MPAPSWGPFLCRAALPGFGAPQKVTSMRQTGPALCVVVCAVFPLGYVCPPMLHRRESPGLVVRRADDANQSRKSGVVWRSGLF